MTARPQETTVKALLRAYPVLASHTIRQGMPVKVTASSGIDYIEEAEATTDGAIGVAWRNSPDGGDAEWPAAAGNIVTVAMFGSSGIVPMRVGTAAAVTAGQLVMFDTAGITNALLTATGAAVAHEFIYGQALETSTTAGELVAVNIGLAHSILRPAS